MDDDKRHSKIYKSSNLSSGVSLLPDQSYPSQKEKKKKKRNVKREERDEKKHGDMRKKKKRGVTPLAIVGASSIMWQKGAPIRWLTRENSVCVCVLKPTRAAHQVTVGAFFFLPTPTYSPPGVTYIHADRKMMGIKACGLGLVKNLTQLV